MVESIKGLYSVSLRKQCADILPRRDLRTNEVVAVKIMEIDQMDYELPGQQKDESIADFIRETKILRQVKDSGAKNVNMIIDSFAVYSQLWLIADYCPGGSVKTLMRATGDRLEERFIIPVARELAEGLRAIHEAGIIHRDVKAANVLIHEEGRLQICDFGVAGILQSKVDKRSTWIGTLHWMPPEMFVPTSRNDEPYKYGSEIDIWAYGCTLFEFATGNPPNANLRDRMHVARRIRQGAPALKGDNISEELQQLVQFVLDSNPITRPTMADIVQHPYFEGTEEDYPIGSVKELVENYYQWSQKGGQRVSLFNPGGAQAAEYAEDDMDDDEDWEFSATEDFEKRLSKIPVALSEGELTPTKLPLSSGDPLGLASSARTPQQQANFDDRVYRGAVAMEGLFDPTKPDYVYEQKNDWLPLEDRQQKRVSDLPLRTDTDRSRVASQSIEIDLGDFDASKYLADTAANFPTIQLADPETIRANRSNSRMFRDSTIDLTAKPDGFDEDEYSNLAPRPPTMDWKFPSSDPKRATRDWKFPSAPMDEVPDEMPTFDDPKRATMEWKFPGEDKRATRDWKFPSFSEEDSVKRATREWTFPSMAEEENEDESSFDVDLTIPEMTPSALAPKRSLERAHTEPIGIGVADDDMHHRIPSISMPSDRPSTALSMASVDTDVDYDPFKLDNLEDQDSVQLRHGLRRMLSNRDAADAAAWTQSRSFDSTTSGYSETAEDDMQIFMTARGSDNASVATPATALSYSPATSMNMDSGHRRPSTRSAIPNSASTDSRSSSSVPSSSRHRGPPISFPEVVPPSAEAMTEGASEDVLYEELERLVGAWTDGLAIVADGLREMGSSDDDTDEDEDVEVEEEDHA